MIRKSYSKEKLDKSKCELCGFSNKGALHVHHIIPKCDPRCSNNLGNLAVVCATCHSLLHSPSLLPRSLNAQYTIIGVYQTTGGRKLMWFKEGEEPPLEKQYWLIKENPLVLRTKKNNT